MKTVQELLIAICDDLQEYLNDNPVMDVEVDVVIRLLELMEMYRVRYIDSVGGVHAPDPAPDPDDAEDKDAADTLEDFDTGEIEKTMEQPLDINSRKPFSPELFGIYRLAGTESVYQCIAQDGVYYTMRNIKTGWTCEVHDIGIYSNYSIDWSYSTKGHFDKK